VKLKKSEYIVQNETDILYTLKVLGYFKPNLDQIWTNPAVGLNIFITFLTHSMGLSIFYPKLG